MSGIASSTGLASGIDTDALIQQLMAIERNPIVRLRQKISTVTQEKDAYRDINSRLSHLKDKIKVIVEGDVFNQVSVSSSNTSVLTATASASAARATYDLRVQQLAKSDSVISAQGAGFTFSGASASIQVNGENVTVYGAELTDLRNAINNTKDADATASIVDGRLIITNKSTGVANNLTLQDNDPDNGILQQLGILIDDNMDDSTIANNYFGDNVQGGYKTNAQDAVFSVDGLVVSRAENMGIDDVIDGVTISLKGRSEYSGAGVFPDDYTSTTLSVAPNDTAVVNAIKSFVDQYNSAIDFLNSITDYDPETKTAGLLQGDFFPNNLRNQIFSIVTSQNPAGETAFRSLFDVVDSNGTAVFTTGNPLLDQGGRLEFDETALRNVLENDREKLYELFAYDSDDNRIKDNGIGYRLEAYLKDVTQSNTGMIAQHIKGLEGVVDNYNDSIMRMELTLEIREKNYRREFATMEQLIAQMQANSSYFGGTSSFLSASS